MDACRSLVRRRTIGEAPRRHAVRQAWHASALALLAIIACHPAGREGDVQSGVAPQGATALTPADQAREELAHPRFSAAGVAFMRGMIAHHAQAIVMAHWAPSHDAGPAVRDLCQRIDVSQADEIRYMESWLTDRHQTLPAVDTLGYAMSGMPHDALMPGMLTTVQMQTLDAARGAVFDRLFLNDMIVHHEGAVAMVRHLMDSGQADDDALEMYATNIQADQAAEIGRMQRMLAMMPDTGGAVMKH